MKEMEFLGPLDVDSSCPSWWDENSNEASEARDFVNTLEAILFEGSVARMILYEAYLAERHKEGLSVVASFDDLFSQRGYPKYLAGERPLGRWNQALV